MDGFLTWLQMAMSQEFYETNIVQASSESLESDHISPVEASAHSAHSSPVAFGKFQWRILVDFSCFLLAGNIRSQVASSNNDLDSNFVIDRSNLKYFTCFYKL